MKILKLIIVVISLMAASCATEQEKMQRYLCGNWEAVYLKLELPSYQGKDTLVEYDIDFENPHDPRTIEQGKSFTTYNSDGTFKTWTEKNNGIVKSKSKGKWRVTKDSMFYDFAQGPGKKAVTVAFELKQIEDGYSIMTIQDRDNDGEQDDTYYLETVRLPDTKK